MLRRASNWSSVALLSIGVVGCSHDDQSPKVTTKKITPDLVCNAQLTTEVELSGDGFAPMTTKALKDKPLLVLPTILLTHSKNLEGNGQKGKSIELSGESGKTNSKALTWQSRRQMTISVSEQLSLDPGIYDILVTNPDGEKKATLNAALAVVPPPVLAAISPKSICNAQSMQTLELSGSTFLQVAATKPTVTISAKGGGFSEEFAVKTLQECASIPGRASETQACRRATIEIPADTLAAGQYDVVLTNPSPAACVSTEVVTLTVNPPPEVTSVLPSTVCSGGSDLTLNGKHFQAGAAVELRCAAGSVVQAQSVTVQNGETLLAAFGAGVAPDARCDVVVTNPDSCMDEPLPHQTVTGTEGPIAFYADPPVAYADVSTRLSVYLTAITGNFEAALLAPDGTEVPLEGATPVPGKNNRIQAVVPTGLAAGAYDIAVRDGTGCRAILPDGLALTKQLAINLASVEPSYAQLGKSTAVTVTKASGGSGFAPTPRIFLMPDQPKTGDLAIALTGVKVLDEGTLTAVVPATASAGVYDLIVVNPTGTEVGLLDKGITVTTEAPPVIDNVVPQSFVAAAGEVLEVRGRNFSAPTVSMRCASSPSEAATLSPTVTTGALNCTDGDCVQSVTVDGSTVPSGSVCVVRLANSDGAYGDFSAVGVTNSSYNLSAARPGLPLLQSRRALSAAAVKATRASRFVYAIGGDTGDGTASRSDVEVSEVDVFGVMRAFQTVRAKLSVARAQAGTATLGRYIYVFGGTSDGAAALDSGERALVLAPEEVPEFVDVDLCLAGKTTDCFGVAGLGAGVGKGMVSYRVAAVIDPNDEQNLGGETLASETMILKLPRVAERNISVKFTFRPPLDATGTALTGITGYRVYRTPLDGVAGRDEMLLGTISGGNTFEFIDDGTITLQTDKPLAPGSTSLWQAIPKLNTARAGLSGVVALQPGSKTQAHLYALLGKSTAGANGGSVLSTYERLGVTILPNGRQTVGSAWIIGGESSSAARWHAGAWAVDHDSAGVVNVGDTWIYIGGGAAANGNGIGVVEAAQVGANGELSAFSDTPADFSNDRSGYGTIAAAGRLYVFGGRAPNPKDNATAALITTPVPTLDSNAWNSEGPMKMSEPRYLHGTAVQSAFIFLLGGEASGGAISNSTDMVIW